MKAAQKANACDKLAAKSSLRWLTAGAILLMLQACSGGSGSDPTENPAGIISGSKVTYTGPDPQTADIQSFRINVWENLRSEDRCGSCHNAGGQVPSFARSDDINLAYNAANTVVNLEIPSTSRMVTKVAEGHNCWQGNDAGAVAACANIVEGYITNWANDSLGGTAKVIQLTPPPIKDAGASKNLPATAPAEFAPVHNLLTTYCSSCHTSDAAVPQTPYFASSDMEESYQLSKSKISLDEYLCTETTPLSDAQSRFVVRLRDQFHNCWTSGNCSADALSMHNAVEGLACSISATQPEAGLVLSKALSLPDGIPANSGGRHEANVIALYEFQTGSGTTAFDTSGVAPEINLTLSGQVEWVGGWGIRIIDGKAQGSTSDSKKLHDLITATGEYSIEAWVAPGNVTQGDAEDPARIISYSAGTNGRNFTLGQNLYNYEFLNRSNNTDANGTPALATNDDDEDLQATLQHVVVTYNPVDGRRVYVNGVFTDDVDSVEGGILADWNDTYALVLGNEVSSNRLWQGVIRLAAIHNRTLTAEQIQQNFDAGVGEKFFLLFSVGHLIDVPQSYIVFEVSQFDSYSYLFSEPFFVGLDANSTAAGIPLQGMRIGINGREAIVGQSYANLDTSISTSAASNTQTLSALGTIIALEKGPETDEFFLTFEVLGSNSNVTVPGTPVILPVGLDGAPASDIGVRTFDEVSATMQEITGVSIAANPSLLSTYIDIKQALPSIEDIEAFLSSHQMAVTQLAIGYCDALVETNPGFFGGVNFNGSLSVAQRSSVIDPLVSAVLGTNIGTQP
ncbi:MAG: LamG domain-containing protein, partial [Pseudomonadales bacterium]